MSEIWKKVSTAGWVRTSLIAGMAVAGLATTLVVTLGVVAISPASAEEDRPNTARDCQSDAGALSRCDFRNVTQKQIDGEPEQVSGILDNCGSTVANTISVDYGYASRTYIFSEEGQANSFGLLTPSVINVGFAMSNLGFKMTGKAETDEVGGTVKAGVPAGSRGWLMFTPYRLDVAGWYDAWYDRRVNGHFNWFWRHKGDTTVHVIYPLTLPSTNVPDGRAWLHTEPCESSHAPRAASGSQAASGSGSGSGSARQSDMDGRSPSSNAQSSNAPPARDVAIDLPWKK